MKRRRRINPNGFTLIELLIVIAIIGLLISLTIPLIGNLIEAGVEILNPVQPECMDFAEIHATYGTRLSFNGTLGTQTTMPFGTPEDVRAVVFRNLEMAGPAGGLLCCPTHLLEPEVPWANIEAYVSACKTFARAGG